MLAPVLRLLAQRTRSRRLLALPRCLVILARRAALLAPCLSLLELLFAPGSLLIAGTGPLGNVSALALSLLTQGALPKGFLALTDLGVLQARQFALAALVLALHLPLLPLHSLTRAGVRRRTGA